MLSTAMDMIRDTMAAGMMGTKMGVMIGTTMMSPHTVEAMTKDTVRDAMMDVRMMGPQLMMVIR